MKQIRLLNRNTQVKQERTIWGGGVWEGDDKYVKAGSKNSTFNKIRGNTGKGG